MRIGSLFSGIGGLELGLEWSGLGHTVWQVEQNSFCRRVLAKHWPAARRYEDVKEVGITNLAPVDLICGGFPCFPAGTLIDSADGLKPIEAVQRGDMVWTHQGRLRAVVSTMRKADAPLVEVRAFGSPPVRITSEHPFYARFMRWVWDPKRRTRYRTWSDPEWVEAHNLTKNHYVAQPLGKPSPGSDTSALYYVIGRWLGDGWIVDHQRRSRVPQGKRGSRVNSRVWKVLICCARSEAESLALSIRAAGLRATRTEDRAVTKFHISSKALVEYLRPFGRLAHGKCIPGWVHDLPIECQAAMLDGWIDADGHRFESGKISVTTVSEALVLGMAKVARTVLHVPAAVYRAQVPRTKTIEGRVVSQRTQFQLVVNPKRHEGFVEDQLCWVPVRSVRSTKEVADVFNFEVEEDNSYVASSFCVHNCQDISSAGKGEGLAGGRSGLWFEYARIVAEIRPRWVVVENVASGAKRWVDQVCAGLGQLGYETIPIPLSAKDVGAPHRRNRIFVIAHTDRIGRERAGRAGRAGVGVQRSAGLPHGHTDSNGESAIPIDAKMAGVRGVARDPSPWATAPRIRRVDDGIPHRVERLRVLGNAVVPQCAEVIGHMINLLK